MVQSKKSDFDPYHRWLGIPPQERPISKYRLLALAEFENDTDVINSAAERQTVYLRTMQAGKHANLVTQLLNDVSQARVTLLDPQKKSDYDTQLRNERAPKQAEPETAAATVVQPTAPVVNLPTPPPSGPRNVTPLSKRTVAKPVFKRPEVIGLSIAGCLLILVMLFMLGGSKNAPVAVTSPRPVAPPVTIEQLQQEPEPISRPTADIPVFNPDASLVIENDELGLQIKELIQQKAELESEIAELAIASKARMIGKTSSAIIPPEAVSFQGHRYHLVENKVPWHQAEMNAAAMGGYLIRLESSTEHDFVISWLKQLNCGSHVHIDGTRFLNGETFLFSDYREMPLDLLHKGNIKGLPQKNWEQFLFLAARDFHINSWHFHQCFYIIEWSADQIPDNLKRKADISGSLKEGLVAYYPFNGNADDESVNDNHGQVKGATLVSDRNKFSQRAFGFDGQSYIRVSDKQYLSGFDSMTVGLWANYTSPVQPNSTALLGLVTKWGQDTLNDTFAVWLSPNGRFHAGSSLRTQAQLAVSGTLKIEQWQHLVYTHDIDSGDNFYVNGTLVDSDITARGRIQVSQNPLYIGADNRDGNVWRHFTGAIDEVRIYNRALSAAEVKAIYEFEKP